VARSVEAGPAWRSVAPADRGRLLRRFAAQVEEHGEELAQLETANVGKPIGESRDEVAMVAEVLYFYAGAVDKHRGATVPVAGGVDMTFHEPLGVVAAIVPWNFPIAITSWKVGPGLATGNTIVVKPAEITPLTALRLAELALDAGIPEGVLQVVLGKGSGASGTRLVEHPDVAKVAFTGSTEVGREVMARASGTIKRVTLELGGKSASVIFADADLERAAAATPGGCVRQRRPGLLCPQPGAGAAHRCSTVTSSCWTTPWPSWKVGDPTDPATARWDRWSPRPTAGWSQGFLAPGMGGARRTVRSRPITVGSGSRRDPGSGSRPRWWHRPIPEWRMAREEIFGPGGGGDPLRRRGGRGPAGQRHPVRAVRFHLDRDGARALRMARAVQAGNLSVNSNSSVRVQTSFGGMKQSGFGRELGPRGAGLVQRREERLRLHRQMTRPTAPAAPNHGAEEPRRVTTLAPP
jgi:acyl-CoA reductase-like NAD-dependent aldehyde dehydrogenase